MSGEDPRPSWEDRPWEKSAEPKAAAAPSMFESWTRGPKAWLGAGVLFVVIASVGGWIISGAGGTEASSASTTGPAVVSAVLYEVEGTASSVSLTLETPTGTSQGTGKAVPLVNAATGAAGLRFTFPAGAFVYLSAQNEGSSGTVTCRISSNGQVVSENTASGGYAIATCKGAA